MRTDPEDSANKKAERTRVAPVLRYPGGKQRLLAFLSNFLPKPSEVTGNYVEPFVGGASVFLHVRPNNAILADSNAELIELYKGIKEDPLAVWEKYASFGSTKDEYNHVRGMDTRDLNLQQKAARLLYLNRTCFKGHWRHNSNGKFNVGYGGESRRWVVNEDYLIEVANALSSCRIECSDFESVVDFCSMGDHLFVDPPYRPGYRELINAHYGWKQFTFEDHKRLARSLARSVDRGVCWCMTTSAHADIVDLYRQFKMVQVPPRTGGATISGEVLILAGGGRS